MPSSIIPKQNSDVAVYNPFDNAKEIHMGEAAMKIARRVKNIDAYHAAVDATMDARLEFATHYKALYPDGGDRHSSEFQSASTGVLKEDYCNQAGVSLRSVQRWGDYLKPEKFAFEVQSMKNRIVSQIADADTLATKHTGDEESYTPSQYIESARSVMTAIDLDPASNDMAQETVQAKKYYTVNDDGLSQAWSGKVWMNPPYTARVINLFIEKLVNHYIDGDVSEAIVLTNNNTDTAWFHQAAASASAICFTAGRINFLKRDGSTSSPTNGQAFIYFGKSKARFKKEFSKYGLVVESA